MKRESIKVSFFRHRAPKKSVLNKLTMIDKGKLFNISTLKAQLNNNVKRPKRNHSTCKELNMVLSADDCTINDRKRSAFSPENKLRFNRPLVKVDNDFGPKQFLTNELETINEIGNKNQLLQEKIMIDRNKVSIRPKRHGSSNHQTIGNTKNSPKHIQI